MAAHEGCDRVVLTVVSQSRRFASTVLKVWQYNELFRSKSQSDYVIWDYQSFVVLTWPSTEVSSGSIQP